eukprot:COSAG06_NODE_2097_length_7603_cov_5.875933_8_plen_40_part_00
MTHNEEVAWAKYNELDYGIVSYIGDTTTLTTQGDASCSN